MSATPSLPQQAAIVSNSRALSPASTLEIDASCRVPVLFLFLGSVAWLLVGSVFELIASLKFHKADLLADCAWFTYGRVHPAHLSALIYGFGIQAGLGVALWMVAHLGRTKLSQAPVIIAGAVLWNLGTLIGLAGILYGDSTGYEWLEMPRYASATLFAAFVLIALGGIVTLHERKERPLFISQWYILAAFFWFPWVYSTANMLLVGKPVRGALQAAIDWWYMNNLSTVWFGFAGVAAIFYFVPKSIKKPLSSHHLGVFFFWTLALFGSWGGIPEGSPLPSWMPALSTMGTVLTIIPALAVAINVCSTMCGSYSMLKEDRSLKFFLCGAMAFVVSSLIRALTSTIRYGKITNFTWFVPAQTQLILYGFFAVTMFGAIYYIVPRLLRVDFAKPGLICAHFGFAFVGIVLYVMPLMIGGVKQGVALNDASIPFLEVMNSSLMFLRVSTLGDVCMIIGHAIMALNLIALLASVSRKAGVAAWTDSTKTVGVAS